MTIPIITVVYVPICLYSTVLNKNSQVISFNIFRQILVDFNSIKPPLKIEKPSVFIE